MSVFKVVPCWRFANLSLEAQVAKIGSELSEVEAAIGREDMEAVKVELMDVIHAANTALQVQLKMVDADVLKLSQRVNEKNHDRGYHGRG